MSYNLDITFTGMFGFVAVEDGSDPAVHVLFPNTRRVDAHGPVTSGNGHENHGGHGHHGDHGNGHHGDHGNCRPMEVHVAQLQFDASALHPEPAEPDERLRVVVSLDDWALEIAGGTRALDTQLTDHLVPMRYLRDGLLGDAANDLIASRVILRSGTEVLADPGALWLDQDGEPRWMSNRLTWRIEGLAEPLELTRRGLRGQAGEALPPLYPDASGMLSLDVFHVPGAELPPRPLMLDEPEPGDRAHHFTALHLLVTEPIRNLPTFVRSPTEEELEELMRRPKPGRGYRGFAPYGCMGSKIEVA